MGRIAPHFDLAEFSRVSDAALTPAEVEAARWWANGPLHRVRQRFGPVVVTSFIRVRENRGPNRGGVEWGPHGRDSSAAGNAVDFRVPGASSREVVEWMVSGGELRHVSAILDGGNHVHGTRVRHPGAYVGAGVEYRKPDGTTGVKPLPGGGAAPGGPSPGEGRPGAPQGGGEMPPETMAAAVLVVVALVAFLWWRYWR